MKIITITLNPAFDLHYEMKNFKLYEENYVESIFISAGGKGINISRALLQNGIKSTAYVILGRENASGFVSKLNDDGIDFRSVYCEGRIRENITIHTHKELETRISLDNFSIDNSVLDKLLEELKQAVDRDTIVTFSGRLPKGLPLEFAAGFLGELKKLGCCLVVDCNSFSMEDLIGIKPWLIKPNQQEVERLIGKKIDTIEQALMAAENIQQMGIEIVIISMGEQGAAAAAPYYNCIVKSPKIVPLSTVGAGDSMIAGFIGAYAQGGNIKDCIINAVSYGTAACLTRGTNPPQKMDIEMLKKSCIIID